MDSIDLKILSPEKELLDCKVSKVGLPGSKGAFTVLKGHCALISSLVAGKIAYTSDNQDHEMLIRSGFVEVGDNKVTACVEI